MCMFGTRMAVSRKSIACKNLRENFIKLERDSNEKKTYRKTVWSKFQSGIFPFAVNIQRTTSFIREILRFQTSKHTNTFLLAGRMFSGCLDCLHFLLEWQNDRLHRLCPVGWKNVVSFHHNGLAVKPSNTFRFLCVYLFELSYRIFFRIGIFFIDFSKEKLVKIFEVENILALNWY